MSDIDLSEYTDPAQPPPGYRAITCPECATSYLKPSSAVKAGVAGERTGSLCARCGNRQWVWVKKTST